MAGDVPSLAQLIDPRTREGELWEPLAEGRLRCYACGHRCVILPGQRGICKVRYNQDGRLLVPWGYVAGLQLDPIEKKPFFHAWPGAKALSFGMLGCDFHCSYCTVPQTAIATTRGPIPIRRLFDAAREPADVADPSIRVSPGLRVYTHTGRARAVRALFRHRYSGPLVKLETPYLPPLRVTPDHEVLALSGGEPPGPSVAPTFVPARELRAGDHVAIPRTFEVSYPIEYEVADVIEPLTRRIRHQRLIDGRFLQEVSRLSASGLTSREIAAHLGQSESHIRHLRSHGRRGDWNLEGPGHRPARLTSASGRVRFSKVHHPGIRERIALDEDLAALFGYYAAEGSVLHRRGRVHAARLVLSLGRHEQELAERICKLFLRVFGIEPHLSCRRATLCVVVEKASATRFFEALCGTGARRKRVPAELFTASRSVSEAFLAAYAEGGGHESEGGMVRASTESRKLALGLAWLALKTGRFPWIRAKRQTKERKILGRTVRLAPILFYLNWSARPSGRRWLREDGRYFYVPIRGVRRYPYHGFVYNLEVEEDRSYLAQFVGTHNCQNALTSQALRDPLMGVAPEDVTPDQVVAAARRHGARVLTSTYNEPLITSEWGIHIFKAGKTAGLAGSYVSNGNATPEVLDYIRPWVELYKVDLKGFTDKGYRKLGGLLQNTLDSIRLIWQKGFWLEIVTLVVPGFNDSDAELKDAAEFLVSVSPDIPWHVTAFHQDYKMRDRDSTSAKTLIRAAEIGTGAGLRYVYAGNLPGRVGPFEHTYCPGCKTALIERLGYRILKDRLTPTGGACPGCGAAVPGRWG